MAWFGKRGGRPAKGGPAVGPPPQADGKDVVGELQDACQDKRHVVVVALDATRFANGHLVSLTEEAVMVDLLPDKDPKIFWPATVCCVSYYTGDGARTFLTRVYRQDEGTLTQNKRLILERRRELTVLKGRMALRIPVPKKLELEVMVTDGERRCFPRAMDISLTGILVSLDDATDPDWNVDHEVSVSLRLRELETGLIPAIIRRRDPGRSGISFQYAMSMGNLNPPIHLRQLVQAIERETWTGLRSENKP